jgi:hypothetical protein
MNAQDFMALEPGDIVELPMDQRRVVEHKAQVIGSVGPVAIRLSVTEAWYDLKYRYHTNLVYHDDAVSFSKAVAHRTLTELSDY